MRPLGAGPESISLGIRGLMDSGLALRAPRNDGTPSPSRGAFRPGLANRFAQEGAGKPGACCTRGPTSIQVQPEHSGIPRAMVLRPGHRPPQKRFRSAGLYFPTRWTVFGYPKFSLVCGGQGVSQFSCMLLLVAALTLTACFGVAAWRISGGEDDVTGSTSPVSIHIR